MAERKISDSLDSYFDRSRKTISSWVSAYMQSELTKVNGNITIPFKKPLQDIYDYVMLDAHLSSAVLQRKSKVTGEEFGVFKDNVLDEDLTKLINKQWFSKLQDYVIDSRFYGYNLIEIQELINNEIKDVKVINRGNVIPELRSLVKNPYQVSLGSLISIDNRNDSDYYILVDSGDLGLLNKVVPLVMMKRLTLSMWANHAETFGIPPIILKTDNKDQVNQFHKDLTQFVLSRKMIIGLDDSLEVLQTGTDTHNIYKELIETCNSEISKAVVGQTSTSDQKAYVGSSEVHERVANEISEADREYMTYIINDIVFPKLINLGYKFESASFKYISKEKRSYQEKLDTIKTLKENGFSSVDVDSVALYLDLPFALETSPIEVPVENVIQKKSPNLNDLVSWYSQDVLCGHGDIENASIDKAVDDFYNHDLESIVDQIISDVYSSNVDPLDPAYIKQVGEFMLKAVYESFNFNGNFNSPDLDGEDIEFNKALRKNSYYFVGGKNKLLKQSFTDLLFNGDNLKTFSQFKQDCQKVGLEFNKNYLKTEYQTAIANAQNASDWNSFDDEDILRYDAVMDNRTRPEHAKLNGLELPKSDRLWDSVAPQNSWNCRCRLLVVPNVKAAKLTAKQRNAYKKLVDEDFKFNPGKTGDLFPPDHPYLKALTKEDRHRIDSMM